MNKPASIVRARARALKAQEMTAKDQSRRESQFVMRKAIAEAQIVIEALGYKVTACDY